jgi:hypothetical protein
MKEISVGDSVKYVLAGKKAGDKPTIVDGKVVEVIYIDRAKGAAAARIDYTTKEQAKENEEHHAIAEYADTADGLKENTFHFAEEKKEASAPAPSRAAAAA